MYPLQLQTILQFMEQRIRSLEDRALMAEKELQHLKESIQKCKPVHIDAINYKVQELAVSDLSGTLNIGLTALSDPKQLEEWIEQNGKKENQQTVFENLQNEIKEAQ